MLSVYLIERYFKRGRWDSLLDGLAGNGLEMPLPLRARLSGSPTAVTALALRRVGQLSWGPTALSRAMRERLVAGLGDPSLTDGEGGGSSRAVRGPLAGGALSRERLGDGGAVNDTMRDPLTAAAVAAALGDEGDAVSPTAMSRRAARTSAGGALVDGALAGAEPGEIGGNREVGRDVLDVHKDAQADAGRSVRHWALLALAAAQGDDGLIAHSEDRSADDRAMTSAFVLCLLAGDDAFRQAVRFNDLLNWFDEHGDELDADTRMLWRLATLDLGRSAAARCAVSILAAEEDGGGKRATGAEVEAFVGGQQNETDGLLAEVA